MYNVPKWLDTLQKSCGICCNIYKSVSDHIETLYPQGLNLFPANIYLCKVNNRNTKKRCEICSKLTIKTPERRY